MITEELLKNRKQIYGDVRDNMHCAADFAEVWNRHLKTANVCWGTKHDRDGYYGCIDMIFHKLARICTGNPLHEDNYEDIKGYIELARKIIMGEYEEKK